MLAEIPNAHAAVQMASVIARNRLCFKFILIIGCGTIIRCCVLSRKSPGDLIAAACRTVYDDCEKEKAMELA